MNTIKSTTKTSNISTVNTLISITIHYNDKRSDRKSTF
jgi:hypothetical protein